MLKKITPLFFPICLLCAVPANAQVGNYSFTQDWETFNLLTTGTTLFSAPFDNNTPVSVTIPAFTMAGTSYTTMWVSPNGFVALGGTQPGTIMFTPISSGPANPRVIAPFGMDLRSAHYGPGTRKISWDYIGSEIIVQWQNVTRNVIGYVFTEKFTFQLRLNTANGNIKFHYDSVSEMLLTNFASPEVGLRGPNSTFPANVSNRTLPDACSNWLLSVAGTFASAECLFTPSCNVDPIISGTYFLWSPPCVTPDLPSLAAADAVICAGESTTLSVTSGNLNNATEWHWYTNSCGGTPIGTGASINVSPAVTTTYYVRGEGGCVSNGPCQSITIPVQHASVSTLTQTACGLFTLNGQTYTTSGNYQQNLTNVNGCDSTLNLNLTIHQPTSSTIAQTACGSFTLNGQTYTNSGNYQQNLINVHGCDSTLNLNLTIHQPTSSTIAQTACGLFTLNGQMYTNSGNYQQNLTNVNGCDSTLNLNLTIHQPTSSTIAQTACGSFTLNGQTYTTSGNYQQNLINVHGCDSTLNLNLTISNVLTATVSGAACENYSLNGITYTSSGIYFQTLTNSAGCDSLLTLNLTILQPTSTSITTTSCGDFLLNGQTYTSSGTYLQTLTNSAGCDSLLTLNLTILQPTSTSITTTSCGDFLLNGQTYTSSGTYLQTLTNSAGCDSLLTLNLTIPLINTSVALAGGIFSAPDDPGYSYQWLNCGTDFTSLPGENNLTFEPAADGFYAVAITADGCTDTTACVEFTSAGLDNETRTTFTCYPNPAHNQVTLSIAESALNSADFVISIFNSHGSGISVFRTTALQTTIDLTHLEPGVYFVSLVDSDGKMTRQCLIKQ